MRGLAFVAYALDFGGADEQKGAGDAENSLLRSKDSFGPHLRLSLCSVQT